MTETTENPECVICHKAITKADSGLCDDHKYDEQQPTGQHGDHAHVTADQSPDLVTGLREEVERLRRDVAAMTDFANRTAAIKRRHRRERDDALARLEALTSDAIERVLTEHESCDYVITDDYDAAFECGIQVEALASLTAMNRRHTAAAVATLPAGEATTCNSCGQPLDAPPCQRNPLTGEGGHTIGLGKVAGRG